MGGKVSVEVREKYNKKTYEQVNFRLRKESYPNKSDLERQAVKSGVSLNAWIVSAVMDKLDGIEYIKIPDLEAYALSLGLTPEEYIKLAVAEKMERQDQEFSESITREQIEE